MLLSPYHLRTISMLSPYHLRNYSVAYSVSDTSIIYGVSTEQTQSRYETNLCTVRIEVM